MVNLRARNGLESDPSDSRGKSEAIETQTQRLEDATIEPMDIGPPRHRKPHFIQKARDVLVRYAHFVGPGFLISVSLLACMPEPSEAKMRQVAYIDPGNYATDVSAGASTQYKLLFIVLMSNLFAVLLQSLCIKLGSVTGLDLAENCRLHLPRWLTITLYLFAEAAIIATDMAEVCFRPDGVFVELLM